MLKSLTDNPVKDSAAILVTTFNIKRDGDDLLAVFGNWIINHILNEDLRFANFVASLEN